MHLKKSIKKISRPLIAITAFTFLYFIVFPADSHSQIVSISLLDLRTNIANHKWYFHPGDSPLAPAAVKKAAGDKVESENFENVDETETGKPGSAEEIRFLWAMPDFKPDSKGGWIDDIKIQRAWTRYVSKENKKPYGDFNKYFSEYKGYGWYRTVFTVKEEDFSKKFKSRDLVLKLGKIGQTDAVYLNGRFIGGTGLRPDTAREAVLDDSSLFYDKIRHYKVPREFLNLNRENVIAVRVFAKYNIAPGLSHDKYYIASARKIDRSEFWDDFKKITVIVLSLLLGIFYVYWQIMFREEDRASIYFSLTAFAMALNTFMRSQTVYSMWNNALWIKKLEFISVIIFAHMLLEFFVNFAKIETRAIKIINRFWDIIGAAAVIAVVMMPTMVAARRFMFAWGIAPALLAVYLAYIIIRARKIPSMTLVTVGFLGMAGMLVNDALVGLQFRWVLWETSMADYAFAFFGMMTAASIVSNMIKSKALIEKQKAEKDRLSKFFSPDVIDEILGGDLSLGGTEKPIATLFADIVGFTSFSEHQTPAKVLERLNDMFTRISEVIITYQATLDKYIGDCVMAFWGAPKASPNDAYKAVACALAMQKTINEMNSTLPEGEPPFRLRIGINYGPAIAGYIGSHERMDYSVIGDAVNTASRIESNGIPGKVAISDSIFQAAGGEKKIKYSETKDITVKGKAEPIRIYIVDEVIE
ncbi:MAG: adenylate/guanylate cyclase domain-containing protein [Spirochaetes bacterium]|jgi:class 3 adenylate cyclase|nr:adenylate/guanylate cyclase domain-containing protein [Spirochaetota bacterium]